MDPLDDRPPAEAKKSSGDARGEGVKADDAKPETLAEPRGTVTITPVVTRKE